MSKKIILEMMMKNTIFVSRKNKDMKRNRQEELYGKCALTYAICKAMDKFNTKKVIFEGYANEKDRVSFQFDGHRCKLLEFEYPNEAEETAIMVVLAKGVELKKWEDVRLNFNLHHFRFETLERIAYEVYDNIRDADSEEWEEFEKRTMAEWFDSLDEFMK